MRIFPKDLTTNTHRKNLLDGVVHGLADVQHGVEDDGVFSELHLVSV